MPPLARPSTRREFVRTSALASSLLILPRGLRAGGAQAPNSRLQFALIGVGGRGKAALADLADEQIVAFCDVDFAVGRDDVANDRNTRDALAKFTGAAWYHDYRLMFEQMADQIDAVVITVPDHMHYAIAMTALRYGKHIFVEKPLCRCVSEVRALHAAAQRAGVVTQMGNQGRTGDGIRLAREWVQAGLIGDVRTVHAWNNTGSKSYSRDLANEPIAPEEPPASLHYDLWLGVAPVRPYEARRTHRTWRGFSDYGSGRLGDWGCHQLDAAFFALDLDRPLSIEPACSEPRPESFPAFTHITWRFAARGNRPSVEVKWFDGGLLPPEPVPGFKFDPLGGSIFYGSKGILWVGTHSNTTRLLPEARMQELKGSLPPKTIPRFAGGPHREFAHAIRMGKRCSSDFQHAVPLVETVLLGVAASRARTRLVWDAENARVTNHVAANAFIGPGYEYRPGWGV